MSPRPPPGRRLALALALLGHPTTATGSALPCAVTVTRDYVLGPSYQAIVQPKSTCPAGSAARVRKRSVLGAITPARGAWTVRPGETLLVWVFITRVEYYAGRDAAGREIWLSARVR